MTETKIYALSNELIAVEVERKYSNFSIENGWLYAAEVAAPSFTPKDKALLVALPDGYEQYICEASDVITILPNYRGINNDFAIKYDLDVEDIRNLQLGHKYVLVCMNRK